MQGAQRPQVVLACEGSEVDLPTLLGLRGGRGEAPTDAVLLESWDGNDVAEERLKREQGLGGDRTIPRSHLTMGIATQPTKLARLLKRSPDVLDNGFFARCLYVVPEDRAALATFAAPAPAAHVEQSYRAGLRRLLDLPWPATQDVPCIPLSPEAEAAFKTRGRPHGLSESK